MENIDFPFGKYHGQFKIKRYATDGTITLEIDGYCGPHDYTGATMAECIAKALDHYFDLGGATLRAQLAEAHAQLAAERDMADKLAFSVELAFLREMGWYEHAQKMRREYEHHKATRQPTQDKGGE